MIKEKMRSRPRFHLACQRAEVSRVHKVYITSLTKRVPTVTGFSNVEPLRLGMSSFV